MFKMALQNECKRQTFAVLKEHAEVAAAESLGIRAESCIRLPHGCSEYKLTLISLELTVEAAKRAYVHAVVGTCCSRCFKRFIYGYSIDLFHLISFPPRLVSVPTRLQIADFFDV